MQSSATEVHCDICSFQRSHLLPNSTQLDELQDILRSNILPREKSRILSVIDGAPLELERYNAKIQRLQECLAGLISDRSKLESYTDGCRSVFSPIRRLPPELLVEIFENCSPSSEHLISAVATPAEETDRLAKKYLLQLSQVRPSPLPIFYCLFNGQGRCARAGTSS
jgi:hypothetical protein